MLIRQSDIDRFWSKIIFPKNEEGCWIYGGCKDKDGYGLFSLSSHDITNTRLHIRASRYMWTIMNGEIPNDQFICHKCDNPSCINPKHLFLGTPKINSQDRDIKNRNINARGEQSNLSILTESQVIEMLIKIHNNEFQKTRQISEYYNVGMGSIQMILNGTSWKHITCKLQIPLEELKNKVERRSIG